MGAPTRGLLRFGPYVVRRPSDGQLFGTHGWSQVLSPGQPSASVPL
ncbi:hypothetical protein ACIBF5_30490 [Micromonospora sp. NPDC050417]